MAYALIRKFNETPFRLSETPPRSSGTCRAGLRWLYSFDVCERFRRTAFTFMNGSFIKVKAVQAPTWAFIVLNYSGACHVVHKRQRCTSDRPNACKDMIPGVGERGCLVRQASSGSSDRPALALCGSVISLDGLSTRYMLYLTFKRVRDTARMQTYPLLYRGLRTCGCLSAPAVGHLFFLARPESLRMCHGRRKEFDGHHAKGDHHG